MTIVFDKAKLEEQRDHVKAMLLDLPADFMETSEEGGTSFLQMCNDKEDVQWTGMHRTMELLCVLGKGLGLLDWVFPKDFWAFLPGGMPYVVITNDHFDTDTDELFMEHLNTVHGGIPEEHKDEPIENHRMVHRIMHLQEKVRQQAVREAAEAEAPTEDKTEYYDPSPDTDPQVVTPERAQMLSDHCRYVQGGYSSPENEAGRARKDISDGGSIDWSKMGRELHEAKQNAQIDAIHGKGAAAALDEAIADGSVFSENSRD
jgi:hypothetical protein